MSNAAEALRLFRREVAQEHAFLRREALFALSFDLGHDPLHLVTVELVDGAQVHIAPVAQCDGAGGGSDLSEMTCNTAAVTPALLLTL